LTLKHTFTYFFDFGDHHEFEVQVVDIQAQTEVGSYPKIIERHGTPPPQYDFGDEEEAWD
jgi:hypothetical protein